MKTSKSKVVTNKVRSGKIPTLLGLIFLLLTVLILNFASESRIFRSGASAQLAPESGRVANIVDHSFSVSWQTEEATTGLVEVFFDGDKKVYFDVRDQSNGSAGSYRLHYVYIDGLEPNTDYQIQLVSGGQNYNLSGEKDAKTSIKTAAIYSGEPPQAKLAFGRIYDSGGAPAPGVLVYLNIPGVAPLSSMTSSSGTWVVPLSFAYNTSLTAPASYQEAEVKEEILVEGANLGRSVVTNYTKDNRPVRNIVLGTNSDFTSQESSSNDELGSYPRGGDSNFSLNGETADKSEEFRIISPGDGETITTTRPEIFGTGPQFGFVKITVESSTSFESSIEIDESESWQWTPPSDLEPGDHTLTVEYTTPQGEKKSFVRNFVVLAAGDENNPAFTATPSGETVSPTATPTTFVPTTTPAPTEVLSPTPTTDLSRSTMPATESGVPETGVVLPVIATFLLGAGLLFVGVFRLF